MSDTIGKTANWIFRHEYKKNGGTLSFANWINREKAKLSADADNNLVLIDKVLNDSVHNAIKEVVVPVEKTEETGNTIFGINKTVFIISALLFTAGGIYLISRISKS